jgi:hypothetical protein
MSDFEWLVEEPMLHEPVLVVMLTGWIDAAGAGATAVEALSYRARRPTMEVREGINSNLRWSTIEMSAGRAPGGRDVVLLTGPEPDMAWHRFTASVTEIAVSLGVRQMAAFGAYPFAAPHTREPRLSCTSPSTDVIGSITFARSSVDVPAGVASALEHALHGAKIPALGIWVQVPHYLTAMSYPAASVALLDGLREYTGLQLEATALRQAIPAQRARIDAMIADNPEHVAMLRQLEELHDSTPGDGVPTMDAAGDGEPGEGPALEMRSGDELAAEIQRFLRDQD